MIISNSKNVLIIKKYFKNWSTNSLETNFKRISIESKRICYFALSFLFLLSQFNLCLSNNKGISLAKIHDHTWNGSFRGKTKTYISHKLASNRLLFWFQKITRISYYYNEENKPNLRISNRRKNLKQKNWPLP